MTETAEVYQRAVELIERAYFEDWEDLTFPRETFEHLSELPHEISEVKSLKRLDISQTSVFRLPRLEDLINLEELDASTGFIQALIPDEFPPDEFPPKLRKLWLNGNFTLENLNDLLGCYSLEGLDLDNTSVSNIFRLEVFMNLRTLRLQNTPVRNLEPVKELQSLTRLDLSGSDVLDLRPLLPLEQLAENPSGPGLTFENCAAARTDPKIAEIAEIADAKERAETLFDYLRGGPKPEPYPSTHPPQDPIHVVELDQSVLEVTASCPTAEEREDALKRAMHRSLPDLLERLAREAGNQFPQLAEAARRLTELLDSPFEDLDMTLLHLGFNELRAAEKSGQEDGMAFAATLQAVLSSACDAGGGLTVDHPMVTLLMDRARKARDNPDPQEDRETQNAMSRQVSQAKDAMGDRLRALEARVANSDDPQDHEAQKAVNRNVLWRIAIAAGGFSVAAVGGKVVGDVLGQPIVDFVMTNLPVLKNAALTYGPVFADWFLSSLAKCQEFAGAIASLSADAQLHGAKKRLERTDT